MATAVGKICLLSDRHVFVNPYPISIPMHSIAMGPLLIASLKGRLPGLGRSVLDAPPFLSYYFYLQILSRSIILLVFLDAVKMNTQGIVIMRNVVKTTKLAEVRRTGFTPMRKR